MSRSFLHRVSSRSERVHFVCLCGVLWGGFGFGLLSDFDDDLRIEVELVLVVPTAAFAVISVSPLQKPEHVEVREMVLDALKGRKWIHSV